MRKANIRQRHKRVGRRARCEWVPTPAPLHARLTNGFSKKVEKHVAMVNLYTLHYNFCRIHRPARDARMEAGLSATAHECEWIVGLMDAYAPAPKKPGPAKGTLCAKPKDGATRPASRGPRRHAPGAAKRANGGAIVRGLKKPTGRASGTLRQAGEVT